MPIPRLHLSTTALLVVDLQENLLGHIHNHKQVLARSEKLIRGCRVLGIPTVLTEQYPKGLGRTVTPIETAFITGNGPHLRAEKLKFSAYVEPVRQFLSEHQIRSVIVCGIEAHVCVLQTCLDLVDAGLVVAVTLDAIGSRTEIDHATAVQRMLQTGVVPVTVESALFEMLTQAGTEQFKAILPLLK